MNVLETLKKTKKYIAKLLVFVLIFTIVIPMGLVTNVYAASAIYYSTYETDGASGGSGDGTLYLKDDYDLTGGSNPRSSAVVSFSFTSKPTNYTQVNLIFTTESVNDPNALYNIWVSDSYVTSGSVPTPNSEKYVGAFNGGAGVVSAFDVTDFVTDNWSNGGISFVIMAPAGSDGNYRFLYSIGENDDPSKRPQLEFVLPNVTAPTVSTGNHSGVTSSSATISNNNLTNMGNATSVEIGVAYGTSPGPTFRAMSGTTGSTGTYGLTLNGLLPNTTYYYRAYAENSAGVSYGTQSSFTTLPNAPTVGISAGTITDNSIAVNATVNNNGGTIGSKGFEGLSWNTAGDGDFSYNFTGLLPNTQYSVRAYAANAGGTGYSGYISPRTLAAVPGLVSVSNYQPNGDVVLSINRNGNPSGTQFFVQRATDASFTQNLATALDWYNPGAGTTLTIPKAAMNAGTEYYFRIMARNADNIQTAYGVSTVSIPMRISDAPGTPIVTPDSDTQMTAAWTAAIGAATYDVYENDVRVVMATAGTSATRPGLTPNTLYKYEIVSNNVSGSSGKSASTSKYTLATVPDLTAAASQQNGNVILTVDKHNNPVATQYYVEKAKASDFSDAEMAVSWTALGAGQNTFTISSLDSDENYYFRIKARNGDSIETAYGATATCITVPTTPSILSADPASNHSIILTWNDVRVDSAQLTYFIYENDVLVGLTTDTTYTHTGLTPNTAYSYKVTAENANGVETIKSSALTAGTLATTPEIDAIEAQANGTVFIYIDGKDNPSGTQYYIEKSTNSTFPAGASTTMGVNWDVLDGNGKMTISGLINGTVYYYRVKARNNNQVARLTVQETAWGDALQSTVITVPAPLSGVPTVMVNSTSKITISWSAVSGAFDYMLYRNGIFVKAVTGTETTDVGLAANSGVVYKVVPRNSSGVSSSAHPESALVYTNAAVPGLTLAAQPSGTEVKVTVAPNGNTAGTQYQAEVSLTGGVGFSPIAGKTTAWSTAAETTITGLTPGTQYFFRVTARNGNNGAGTSHTSAYSEMESTYTVVGQPAQPTTSGFALNSIKVSWNAVTGATGYKLYRDGVYVAQMSALTYTDTGLTPNSAYTYTVAALNDGGMGEQSTASAAVYTKAALPTSAAVADATSDKLIFNITPSNANDVKPQYKIIIKIKSSGVTAQQTSWSRNTSHVEVMGLTPGVEYEVWMAVRNEGSPVTKLVTDGEAPAIASVYTNSPPEGAFTSDGTGITTLRSYQAGHSGDFVITGKAWDPYTGDALTVTAVINGVQRTAILTSAPLTEPSSDNFTLSWDVYSLSAGTPYTDIVISLTDAYGATDTLTYKGTFELDLTPPAITVTGDATVWLNKGDAYIDDGAMVTGANTDGVVTDALAVDTNTAGTYTVTYTATDEVGNTSTKTRTVKVVEPLTMGNVTVVPNSIGEDSAIISSNIAELGKGKWAAGSEVIAHGYIWSTAEIADEVDLTALPADTFSVDLGAKADTMAFLHGLTGLTDGTLYYARAYAETADGVVALSAQTSFTTLTAAEAAAQNYSRLSFKADSWSIMDVEKNGSVVFKVVRTGDTTSELSVDYSVFGGTAIADTDYEALNPETQTLSFGVGEMEQNITINLMDNSDYSPESKTLYIQLSNPQMTNDTEPLSDGVLLIVDRAALVITENDAPTVTPPPVLSGLNQISTFILSGVTGTVTHDTGGGDGDITLIVPYGTDLTSLTPTAMTVPSNATLYPSSGTARNFTNPLVYLVQAEDGTLKRYIVTVTVAALAGDADLSNLAVSGASGNIPISPAFTADSTEYTVSVDNATDQLTVTPTLSDPGATYVIKAGGIAAANPIPLSVGTTVITVEVTAADGTTAKIYTVSVTRAGSTGVSSNTNLSSLMVNTGTLNPAFNKSTTDYKMTLTNGTSTLSVTAVSEDQTSVIVIRANGTIVTSGQNFALDEGANVVSVTVTASNGQSKTYAIAVTRQEAATGGTGGTGGGTGGGGGGTGGGTSETGGSSTDISDKKIKEAVDIDKNDDGSVTITLKDDQFKDIIKDTKTGGTIVIPVTGGANPVKVDMSGDLFKELQEKKAVLVVESEQGTVKIPATGFKPSTLTDIFGPNVDPKDVTVTVTLSTPSGNAEKNITTQVEKTGAKVMMPSVILDITATHVGNSANIGESDTYMTMTVPIPEGVDPSKVSTAVFVDANGGVHHVPTKVSLDDGKYCATVSTHYAGVPYSFIWNPVEFTDVTNHWAKAAVNDMGSRMIISGVGNGKFEADRDITRGEFAAIIVRALGLMPGTGSNPFSDVGASEWYRQYIQTASEYGIISGYGSGKFGPDDKITREQAMTMIARAMKITELKAGLQTADIKTLLAGFGDSVQVAAYAKESIAACIKTGVVSGKSGKLLAPTDEITRAEVAVIVQRLLQKSGLI